MITVIYIITPDPGSKGPFIYDVSNIGGRGGGQPNSAIC